MCKVILFTDNELKAENYFFKNVTLEVNKFEKPKKYEKADGILYYTSRILPTEGISTANDSCYKRFSIPTFCVPVIYRHSPLI